MAIPVTILLGPTATGKSELAVSIAETGRAEIISADSMQIYRGMDIGTAKPSQTDRARIPHHLLDICEPTGSFSVAEFVRRADEVTRAIHARGHRVLMVGGTALYLKGFIEGIFEGPGKDTDVRNRILQECEAVGAPAMHHRLEQLDPEAAYRIHANDVRRIIRAFEVMELTGKPISYWQKQEGRTRPEYAFRTVGLTMPREVLYRRINARVMQMVNEGLIEETQRLLDEFGAFGEGPLQALGYREVIACLQGRLSQDEMIAQIKQGTRRFAKRQISWFKRFRNIDWIVLHGGEDPAALAAQYQDRFFSTERTIHGTAPD